MELIYKKSSPILTASDLEATIFTGVDAGIMGTIFTNIRSDISRVFISIAAFVGFKNKSEKSIR